MKKYVYLKDFWRSPVGLNITKFYYLFVITDAPQIKWGEDLAWTDYTEKRQCFLHMKSTDLLGIGFYRSWFLYEGILVVNGLSFIIIYICNNL